MTCIAYYARQPPSAKHEIWRNGSKTPRKTPVFSVLVRQLAEGGQIAAKSNWHPGPPPPSPALRAGGPLANRLANG
jgi:hypothetical protein